jgi:hypothetical protein
MYVVALERYFNCPTHDSGSFIGQKGFTTLGDLLEFVKKELNYCHVISTFCTDHLPQDFFFSYEKSGHKFIGCELKIDGAVFAQLRDNGSGKLEWFYE